MKILFIGDGQLGQMLGASATSHGHECLLFSTRTYTVKPLSAQLDLSLTLTQAIDWADVVSWEHEDIPADIVAAARTKFLMDPERIQRLTDRREEKSLFDECGVATSPWQQFSQTTELEQLLTQAQQPLVIKSARGGYDGKGQWRYTMASDPHQLAQQAGQAPGIVEQLIPFQREVSLVGARSKDGSICCYLLVTHVHERGILSYTLAGMDFITDELQQQAETSFRKLTDALHYVGVLAIEFFVVGEGADAQLLVNEIAPRVHNSGHWTMTGANSSQFDLHIRALTGMPLPLLRLEPTLMLNVIGAEQIPDALWHHPDTACFWYNKEPRPGRKVGHVNIATESRATALTWVAQWASQLQVLAD